MRRNVDPDYAFDKVKFAQVLKKAIGGLSNTQYAKKADMSVGYVSRYTNMKCDSAPTISTIKKLVSATSLVSYEEMLEAAGYEASKYVNLEDDIGTVDLDNKASFMSYFNSVFSAVTKADFTWKFSSHAINGKDPFTLEIEGAPFKEWYFIPITKAEVKKEDIVSVLSGRDDFTIEPNSKVSFLTASKNMYDTLKKIDLGIIYLYISIILVDSENGNISEETYLKTASPILPEDKDRYSILSSKDGITAPFYLI